MLAYRQASSPPQRSYTVSVSYQCNSKLNRIGLMGVELRRPIMREIAQEVAQRHGLTVEQLRGHQRHRKVAWPRQELMYELYATGRFSSTQIGIFLGERDHTTVLYGCRRHAERNGLPHIAKAAEVRA